MVAYPPKVTKAKGTSKASGMLRDAGGSAKGRKAMVTGAGYQQGMSGDRAIPGSINRNSVRNPAGAGRQQRKDIPGKQGKTGKPKVGGAAKVYGRRG